MLRVDPHAQQPERAIRPKEKRRDFQHFQGVPVGGGGEGRGEGGGRGNNRFMNGRSAYQGVHTTMDRRIPTMPRRRTEDRGSKGGVPKGGLVTE